MLHIQPSQTLHIYKGKEYHISYITIIPQCAEGNHYNVVNGELSSFCNCTSFYFQSDSSVDSFSKTNFLKH